MSSRSRTSNLHSANWDTGASIPWTRLVVDFCLAATFLIAPFCMGGREPAGQFVLALFAGIATAGWASHQLMTPQPAWRWSGLEWLMLSGVGLIVFQLVPLTPTLLEQISPRLPQLLPMMWGQADPVLGVGVWKTITLAPYLTLGNLATLVSCVTLFFILVQRVVTWEDVQHLVTLLIVGAVIMAAFGCLQFATSNGKYFWIYEHVQASTKFAAVGSFANANHFADFLAMTVPLQIWMLIRIQNTSIPSHQKHRLRQEWIYREVSGLRLPAWLTLAGLAITGLAILLSMSRGGIALTCLGTTVVLFLFWRKSLLTAQVTAILGVATIAGLLGTMLFGDLAAKMIEQNFVELTSSDVNQLDQGEVRRRIWAANVEGIREFPILGTGLGTHSQVYRLWYDYPDNGKIASHAENGYLQVALETGLTGLGIVGLMWILVLFSCMRVYFRAPSTDQAALSAAVFAALCVNLAHSLTDFVWYAPSCVMVLLALGVIASRCCTLLSWSEEAPHPAETHRSTIVSPSRLGWGLIIPSAVLFTAVVLQLKWTEAAAFSRAYSHRQLSEALLASKQSRDATAEDQMRLHKLQIQAALDSIAVDPNSHQEQMRAGLAYAKLFLLSQQARDDAMPLIHLQDAARASEFSTAELSAWLDKPGVLGEDRQLIDSALRHFRESLRCCPIQGRSYVELASMVWTEGATPEDESAILKQALNVNPHEASVLFAFAYRVVQSEGLETALPYLRKGFTNGPEARTALMTTYAAAAPASFFLENFELNYDSLNQLEFAYRDAADQAGYHQILSQLADASVAKAMATSGIKAEEGWLTAHRCFVGLQDPRKAYYCGMAALEANPSSYNAHQTLGLWLYRERKYAAASEHLLWCHRRRPSVEWIRTLSENALAQSHLAQSAYVAPLDVDTIIQVSQEEVILE